MSEQKECSFTERIDGGMDVVVTGARTVRAHLGTASLYAPPTTRGDPARRSMQPGEPVGAAAAKHTTQPRRISSRGGQPEEEMRRTRIRTQRNAMER
ncbi:MAG: hypothetical protein QOI08_1250 [Actinomycetota bacterium]|nr:hypothetical protein [Actinomycetota bacterium]